MRYRRNYLEGGTYFFTVNLLERKKTLLIDNIDALRDSVHFVKHRRPFHIDAWVVLADHLQNYALDISNVRYVDEEMYKKWTQRLKPKVGDIIFTREAPAGEAAVVHTNEKIFLGQRTMHFRPDQEKILSEYLMFELMGGGVRRQLNRMHAGSTVTHLSVPDCKKFQI